MFPRLIPAKSNASLTVTPSGSGSSFSTTVLTNLTLISPSVAQEIFLEVITVAVVPSMLVTVLEVPAENDNVTLSSRTSVAANTPQPIFLNSPVRFFIRANCSTVAPSGRVIVSN
jgi:hypothetical protein